MKQDKPFQKGHLQNSGPLVMDRPPEVRREKAIKANRIRESTKALNNIKVTLDWGRK